MLSNTEGAAAAASKVHIDSAWFEVYLKGLNQAKAQQR
jgi:hypothetical protein